VKLNNILNCILGQLYNPWKELEASNWTTGVDEGYYAHQVSSIIRLDHDLDLFEAELPETLRWPTTGGTLPSSGTLLHQQHTLRTR